MSELQPGMYSAPSHQGKWEKHFDGRMEPMWIAPVTPDELMLPAYAWFTPAGAQLGVSWKVCVQEARLPGPGQCCVGRHW